MPLRKKSTLDIDRMSFGADLEGEDHHAQRMPLMLVLDTSGSMHGERIAELNLALADMVKGLSHDLQLSPITEIAIVTFGDGGVRAWRGDTVVPPGTSPFVPVRQLRPPSLKASGVTPMVEAIDRAMQCIAEEKADLKRRRLQYYCPHFFLMSDGLPTNDQGNITDDWRRLPAVIAEQERARKFVFFALGVADIAQKGDEVLHELSPRGHLSLRGVDFRSVLRLVSNSAEAATRGDDPFAIKERLTQRQRRAMR
jgi:uncharacterized protein YegL